MTRLIKNVLIVIILGLTASIGMVSGAEKRQTTSEFYVAVSGNDSSGDGSSSNPWASIQHALTQVPDGSTILVQPGTYFGRQRIRGEFSTSSIEGKSFLINSFTASPLLSFFKKR